ncbi:MAG: hypothetical protein K7J46_02385 [Bryobacter sp.]|jgi:hypothetical protein|nr:hypothetical protein [Bryobacter sp. CoA8 C33]
MNPYLISAACLAQVAILAARSPWREGVVAGVGISLVVALLAFTRLRWGAHLDMYLAMLSHGGFGMLAPAIHSGAACPHEFHWEHYAAMSAGMWILTLIPVWRGARCVTEARRQGRGFALLLMDGLGMQIGMGVAHLPLLWVPMGDARLSWLSQGLMLTGMGLGMMAAQWFAAEWFNEQIPAVGSSE